MIDHLLRVRNGVEISKMLKNNFLKICKDRFLFHQSNVRSSATASSGPLDGIRVLDISRVLAGPYCTMILGDMGAEVIKVERPGFGDDTRSWGPPFVGNESCYFLCVNRNKKSVAVDMKRPEGVKIIKELAKVSDVLVENYLPGKMSEMGLGYPELSAEFPHLIYCSITGYGQTGESAMRPGYDVIVSGVGGLMHITGNKDGDPCKVGVAMTDLSTGLYGVGAILASVLSRQKTGRGQHIDCNLLSTNVASLVNIASNYLNNGIEAERHGTAHPSIVPYQAFKTKDGYLLVGAGNDSQFRILSRVIGHKELGEDERYLSNKLRVQNRESLLKKLNDIFITKSTPEWSKIFEGEGFPYGPINNMQQTFSDPQVIHNGLVQEMAHPTAGTIRVAGPAVRYSETKTVNPVPPPLLGEHTRDVLRRLLGYSDDVISDLKSKNIIEESLKE